MELVQECTGEVKSTGLGSMRAKLNYCTAFDPSNPSAGASCFCVRYSPCDRYLAVSFSNGAICIFNANTGGLETTLCGGVSEVKQAAVAMQLRWRPGSLVLMSGNANADFDGKVEHYSAQTGKLVHSMTERDNQVLCVDYFPDGQRFATAGYDRKVRIYDDQTKALQQTLERGDGHTTCGHSNHIFSLKCHPSAPNILFSGGWDNTVQFWDTRQSKSFRSLSNCQIHGDTLDYDGNIDQLLTGCARSVDSLQLWDFGTGQLVETIKNVMDGEAAESSSMIFTAQFSKDAASKMLACGGHNAPEAKFHVREARGTRIFGALVGLEKPVFSLDFAHNSKMVAVGAADGVIRVIDLDATG